MALRQLDTRRDETAIWVQPGGPGNAWKLFSEQGGFGAISGGGQAVASRFGRNNRGNTELIGTIVTGDKDRTTFTLTARIDLNNLRREIEMLRCEGNVYFLQRCSELYDPNNYEAVVSFLSARTTSVDTTVPLSNNLSGAQDDSEWSFPMSAGDRSYILPVRHDNITKTHTDAPINKIINVNQSRCQGNCGDIQTGEEDFLCVTDSDTTPGYLGVGTPLIGFTRDGGKTWTFQYIDVFQGGNAVDVALVGDTVVVVGPSHGTAFATLEDIYNQVAAPWTSSTGITAGDIMDVAGFTVFIGGTNGRIWRSTDGGRSFTTLVATDEITTQNLTGIAVIDENTVWFGGAAYTFLRYNRGAVSSVTVTTKDSDEADAATITPTANINVLASPHQRGREVYVGGADGHIYRSKDAHAATPTFRRQQFIEMGEGSISDIQFAGWRGEVGFVLQRNDAGQDRVLRDKTGGAFGLPVERVGDFNSPGNSNINSIAPANPNYALTAGELNLTNAFIGRVVED